MLWVTAGFVQKFMDICQFEKTLVSKIPVSLVCGPLKTITYKKFIDFFSTLNDRRMARLSRVSDF